jgi:DUF1009 family protein
MTRERIGLVAGNGSFPVLFAETASARGMDVVAVAHVGETDPAIERHAAVVTWVRPGRVQDLIDGLTAHHVRRAVMVGGIVKPRLFHDFEPDQRALEVIERVGALRDDVLLRALAEELARDGVEVVESTTFLRDVVPRRGHVAGPVPSEAEWADVRFGFRVAKAIGRFDIGQSVVVRGGAVVAVEGIEGTDATIRRAGTLVAGDVVVVKACKPTQDVRFDLPAIGPHTMRVMAEVGGRVLAVEADRTVMMDKEELLRLAGELGIAVVAVSEEDLAS